MAQVEETFTDYSRPNSTGFIELNAGVAFNPYTWKPPINWTGFVNGTPVNFTQVSASGSHEHNFDFSTFPIELKYAIPNVISAINGAMRTMD